ncbi:MAG: LysR family transcriptional regulator [Ruminococcaceae bacterium]|nr:LysR family transcriptional regulator [Oscillospiraceae bacterium]
MNIMHLKYAVEVARTGSITQAAENLFMGQPNLSKAIRELEESLGITIFKRTSKGIIPTMKGEEFLVYAKRILAQIHELESIYSSEHSTKQSFSISIPRASYQAHAFTRFVKTLDPSKECEILYSETNSMQAISNIVQSNYNLGIIRYRDVFEPYFTRLLREKDLKSELVWQFQYVAVMSKNHPLANKPVLTCADFSDAIEILHSDNSVPSLPTLEAKRMENIENSDKRIYVFERGSQFDLLANIPGTFMWVSNIPQPILDLYGLVQRRVSDSDYSYKDMLVYQRSYRLSELDQAYLNELRAVIAEIETMEIS